MMIPRCVKNVLGKWLKRRKLVKDVLSSRWPWAAGPVSQKGFWRVSTEYVYHSSITRGQRDGVFNRHCPSITDWGPLAGMLIPWNICSALLHSWKPSVAGACTWKLMLGPHRAVGEEGKWGDIDNICYSQASRWVWMTIYEWLWTSCVSHLSSAQKLSHLCLNIIWPKRLSELSEHIQGRIWKILEFLNLSGWLE